MQWQDFGYLLSTRSLGEAKVIATFLTKTHGPVSAVARVTKKLGYAPFQPGNYAEITWTARLQEQLGRWTIEVQDMPSARMMHDQYRILMLSSACLLVQMLLPDRNPCPDTYANFESLIKHLDLNIDPIAKYCQFELELIKHMGFGLDLSKCVATGATESLTYISPRTGRAVCQKAGQPYHDKLFPLLPWFLNNGAELSKQDAATILNITNHFIVKNIINDTNATLPLQREQLIVKLDMIKKVKQVA